jgi:hypothetical protein
MTFDDELRRALRRVAAPDGFAAHVAARAMQASGREHDTTVPTTKVTVTSRRVWLVAGLAASLAVVVGGGLGLLEHRRVEEAREARELAVQALRLASVELNQIHTRVAAHASEERR